MVSADQDRLFERPTFNRRVVLNGSHYETLESLPSALEFSQLVRISRPALIRGT